jgi:Peptidase family S51
VKLLLTSAGLRNQTLRQALHDLLGKPFASANIVYVPTASLAEPGDHGWFIADLNRLHGLGWREFDILELNGLPRQMVLARRASGLPDLLHRRRHGQPRQRRQDGRCLRRPVAVSPVTHEPEPRRGGRCHRRASLPADALNVAVQPAGDPLQDLASLFRLVGHLGHADRATARASGIGCWLMPAPQSCGHRPCPLTGSAPAVLPSMRPPG